MRLLLTADPGLPVPPATYGGIERIVDALARTYQSEGDHVALLASEGSTCPVDELFPWPARPSLPATCLALAQAVHRFRPDLVHCFSRLAGLLPLLPRRLSKLMSYQRHTGGTGITWASRLAGPSLHFTACSDFIASMGRPRGGAWHVIPNFVDLPAYTFQPAVPPGAPLVFLSRLDEIKGPDLAIDIARRAGRRLLLAGNRPTDPAGSAFFEKHIAPSLGKDGIEWIGEVNDVQKNSLLGSAAALLVPIRWDEPFGIVFAEALACGTPVISCPRGALPEIIQSGVHGFLIDCAGAGVHAVHQLPSLSRAACRHHAETRFSLDVIAPRYRQLYRRMLHG